MTVYNYVFTYVVENETSDITDLVCYTINDSQTHVRLHIVVSTHSPVKQLILDMMVCARNNGAKTITLVQWCINSDVLRSLGFQSVQSPFVYFYNYKYHEIHQNNCFGLI